MAAVREGAEMAESIAQQVEARLAAGESVEAVLGGMTDEDYSAYSREVGAIRGRALHEPPFTARNQNRARAIAKKIMGRHGLEDAFLRLSLDADRIDFRALTEGPETFTCELTMFPEEGWAVLALAVASRIPAETP
jgi:hypothetical protein